jgi:molybdate-binding protein/DNA-binding transcriptional regulator YhcF (GntR family)
LLLLWGSVHANYTGKHIFCTGLFRHESDKETTSFICQILGGDLYFHLMDDSFLYRRIAEDIRQEILKGKLQPGDRLPSIRALVRQWNCTPGTIQRAYQELARQGLVVSQAGKGTHVSNELDLGSLKSLGPMRRAGMVHRAEAFLLEALTLGYELDEIQQAMGLAMDRWRVLQKEEPQPGEASTLRFAGSHDLAIVWISDHFDEIAPGCAMRLNFNGSLGGLIALAEGKADISGCHLFDAETGTYNEPYIRRFFPGKEMLTVRLAGRSLGLIVPPGNPFNLIDISDLAHRGVIFANRQPGSETRVWLDDSLRRLGVNTSQIKGYSTAHMTHSEVARAIADGAANTAVGLAAVADAFRLDFIPLHTEPYDLVMERACAENEPYQALIAWLGSPAGHSALEQTTGYDASHAGETRVIA